MKFVVTLALLAVEPLPARCSRMAARARGSAGGAPPESSEEAALRPAHGHHRHHHHHHHHGRQHDEAPRPQPVGLRAEAAGPASTPFDCEAGRARWRLGWSEAKKGWCCKHEWWPECEDEGYASSSPFDCEVGVQRWELGWSDAKKDWCCQNEPPRGCTPTTTTTTPLFDCKAGLDKWETGWSSEKKEWCCEREPPRGCLPFDCDAGLAKWETGWSGEKKEWCCHNEPPKGCQTSTTTTTPRFDCQAGLAKWETGWSDEKKEWCCEHAPPRGCLPFDCEAGLDRWESGWSAQKQEWCCEHGGRGCPSRTTTTTTTSSTTPFDCDAGLSRWKTGWSDDKKQWCCEQEPPKGCDEPAFDCDAGLAKWVTGWSEDKKEWCCEHEPPKGCTVTTSTTTTTPYDCDAGLPKWESGWSEAKKEWCCANEPPKGCANTTTETTTTPFDCDAGLAKWETGWSGAKKRWCCKHESPKGCSPGDLEAFDCDAGLSKWETGWSDDKKEWCCEHQPPSGCATTTTTTTTTTARFDCDAGLSRWDTGWSDDKKDWCCKNEYPKGCSVDELPFDCGAGVPKWETGWSDAKKDWCCEHQPHKECPGQFNCTVGDVDWKAEWTSEKKRWCCKHRPPGGCEEEDEEEKAKAEPEEPREPGPAEAEEGPEGPPRRGRPTLGGAGAPPLGPFPWVYEHSGAVARDLELRAGARFFPEGASAQIDMTENDRHRSDAVFSREPSVFDGCVLVRDFAAPLRVGAAVRRQRGGLRRNDTEGRTAGIPTDLPDDMYSGPGEGRKRQAPDRLPESALLLRGGAYDLDSADTFGEGGGRANAELQMNMFAHLGSVAGEVPVVPHGAVANWMSKRRAPGSPATESSVPTRCPSAELLTFDPLDDDHDAPAPQQGGDEPALLGPALPEPAAHSGRRWSGMAAAQREAPLQRLRSEAYWELQTASRQRTRRAPWEMGVRRRSALSEEGLRGTAAAAAPAPEDAEGGGEGAAEGARCWAGAISRELRRRVRGPAPRAVDITATNEEFGEWLQYRDHLANEGLQDIALHSYLTLTRRTTREQYKSIRDEYANWREERGDHVQHVSYFQYIDLVRMAEGRPYASVMRGTFSIACEYQGSTQLDSYKTNIVSGCGKDLPAILGLDSMQDKRTIIVLERGQEKLLFLGKGQVKMELPEGSKIMPTTKLPSGHLSIRAAFRGIGSSTVGASRFPHPGQRFVAP
ncbi:unnamed protein product [Prorocentrum cordatum]|uniref:NAD(P)(+)--arginine ADP-ribosyltransferase n=1 Tax=Prorocentrum cordatum TaxID=2364126 RepID=A0ABN9VD48_9DINO|nr:unnamed protein product [Polarella glacialis]